MSKWNAIDKMESFQISYLLYLEGKSINIISKIRNLPYNEVEKHIIEAKIKYHKKKEEDKLIKIISMQKEKRIEYINTFSMEEKENLAEQIYKRYIKFKNDEDRMILIWLIGELKKEKLIPFLLMELKSKNVNYRRLSISALGKIKSKEYKDILEKFFCDDNPQVRQYAIKSIKEIGDKSTIDKLKLVLNDKNEKEYVKRAATEAIKYLKAN